MHVILRRLRARPEREAEFAEAYGPGGIWARFYESASGFVGTELMRGSDGTYLVIDRWESEDAHRAFREASASRFDEIDRACAALTIEETFLAALTA